jgi:hypothetical protein
VLQRADPAPNPLTSAAANALAAPTGSGPCPFAAGAVDAVLGAGWTASSLPTGGCSYTRGSRSILLSTVPLPTDAKGRDAALTRVRKPCDAGSTRPLAGAVPGSFVCRQDSLVEAATVSGDHLLVLCTAAGPDPAQVPARQTQLGALLEAAAAG